MPRIARAVAVGFPHHVTQRSNRGDFVFEDDGDYLKYLEWLRQYSAKAAFEIQAYCIMSNHVHFIGIPINEDSLSRTFNVLHMRYSQYFNRKKKLKGHLWQGRFYSCALDEGHLYAAIRYVENNPVRAGIVVSAEDYRWSSAKGHVSGEGNENVSRESYLFEKIQDWAAYLNNEDNEMVGKLRKSTLTGRPCGASGFIGEMESLLHRNLHAASVGRPRLIEK
jgi:putative transposase